ncbi:protein kinase [Nocardia sp. CDC159]|uniref:non-specific serine/threonine protein kinase n=1 Tax=Nocardia pulmonis TaxID=2951408 RepID=A0A9X2IYN3_9NOCA|nr:MULTISPECIES: protein kinase [Nocardia]MCM6776558.1 protein kinase [Nocardia pulmonis]MCM6788982.1 protein kinase [Nocardia sp. CDC159]
MDAPRSRVGSRFGPYELRSLLGRGGMGEVYEAYDSRRDRLVALKLLPEQSTPDPNYRERFRREARAAAGLSDPHLVSVHEAGEIDGVLYLDMQLVRGQNLRALLREEGPMAPERAVSIVSQVASALDVAHAAGLVHRDVKPANILVTAADFAYLADFGLARSEGDTAITLAGTAIGSYIYMAPERFDDGPVSGRADIYSLACVLHECLTGATPFPAQSVSVLIRSHLSEPPPRPSLRRSDVPEALDAVIAHAMAKSPADRFATASEFADAAAAALGIAVPPTPPTPDAPPAPDKLFMFGEPLQAAPGIPGAPAAARPVRSLLGTPPKTPPVSGPGARPETGAEPGPGQPPRPDEPAHPGHAFPADNPARADAPARPGHVLPTDNSARADAPARPGHVFPADNPSQAGVHARPGPVPDGMSRSAAEPPGPRPGETDATATAYLPAGPGPGRIPSEPTTFQPFGPEGPTIPAQMRPRDPAGPSDTTRVYPASVPPAQAPDGTGRAPAAQGYPIDESEEPTVAQRREPPAPEAAAPPGGSPTMVMRTGAGTGQPSTADSATTFLNREDLPGADAAAPEAVTRTYETTGTLRIIPPTDPEADQDGTGDLPVIHPADPTLVRPEEFQFVPLPPQAQARPPAPWELPPRHDFPPRGEYAGPDDGGYDDYDYDYDPAEPRRQERRRSIAVPIVLGVCGVVLAAIAGAVGWHVMNKPDDNRPAVATGPAAPTVTPGRTTATTAAPNPTTTAPPTTTGAATPPVGATACPPATTTTGRFAKSATGSTVTTCGFAEEVRKAYAKAVEPQSSNTQAAGATGPTSVVATSPATGRSYTMSCTAAGQLVTCTGGDNAVVYVY